MSEEIFKYKNRILASSSLLLIGGCLLVELTAIYVLFFDNTKTALDIGISIALIGLACFFQWLAWQSSKTEVLVTANNLILKQFNKTCEVGWNEIQNIQQVWTIWAGLSYFIKTKRQTIGIPDTVERCDELLAIIQERSGKRIISEWRGAKDSLREEWQAFSRWVRTHKATVLVILLLVGGAVYAVTSWAIQEYRTYHPTTTSTLTHRQATP